MWCVYAEGTARTKTKENKEQNKKRGWQKKKKRYLVKDDYPDQNFFDFMEPYCKAKGLSFPPKSRTLPRW